MDGVIIGSQSKDICVYHMQNVHSNNPSVMRHHGQRYPGPGPGPGLSLPRIPRHSIRIKRRSSDRPHAILQIQHQSICRVAIQIIPVQLLTPQEPESLVQLDRSRICDFGFQDDLQWHMLACLDQESNRKDQDTHLIRPPLHHLINRHPHQSRRYPSSSIVFLHG